MSFAFQSLSKAYLSAVALLLVSHVLLLQLYSISIVLTVLFFSIILFLQLTNVSFIKIYLFFSLLLILVIPDILKYDLFSAGYKTFSFFSAYMIFILTAQCKKDSYPSLLYLFFLSYSSFFIYQFYPSIYTPTILSIILAVSIAFLSDHKNDVENKTYILFGVVFIIFNFLCDTRMGIFASIFLFLLNFFGKKIFFIYTFLFFLVNILLILLVVFNQDIQFLLQNSIFTNISPRFNLWSQVASNIDHCFLFGCLEEELSILKKSAGFSTDQSLHSTYLNMFALNGIIVTFVIFIFFSLYSVQIENKLNRLGFGYLVMRFFSEDFFLNFTFDFLFFLVFFRVIDEIKFGAQGRT